MALVLQFTGAGLMAKILWTLLQVPPGFERASVTARTVLAAAVIRTATSWAQENISKNVRLPAAVAQSRARHSRGVQSTAFTAYLC